MKGDTIMSRKYRFLAVAVVLVVVLLAVFTGASCTGNVSADDDIAQGRFGQKGAQGQNYNGDCERLCDGTGQGNRYGNCNGECDGECDGTGQGNCNGDCDGECVGTGLGNCNGDCDGECDGPRAGTAGGRWSGIGGCCPGGYNGTLD